MPALRSPQFLARDVRIGRLARALSVHPAQAIGHLHFLWWWAMDGAPDGDLSRFSTLEIAEAAHWHGDPQALVDALIAAGWLDLGQVLASWAELGGRTLKQREQARERQARRRQRLHSRHEMGHADDTPESRVTSRVTSLSDQIDLNKEQKRDRPDLRSEDEGVGEVERLQEIVPPPAGFPQTEEEARSSAARVGLPDGIAARVWQHIARQSFKDRKGRPLRSWEAYLRRCCAVERESRQKEPSTSDWDSQHVPKGLEGVHIIRC